jgi:membrane associated rhomboid family serine protease
MAVCYRHPNRETGVSCSNCGNPICPDCMTPTPVGMRCPECAKQKTKVRNVAATYSSQPNVAIGLIALNVLVFIGMSSQGGFGSAGGSLFGDFALAGPFVHDEPYRLITSGFMHSGFLHIAFNMYVLWFLGQMLEPALGPFRFGGLYLASLLAGSFGAVLIKPDAFTVGASGAVFGLMGAAFVMQRARGIDPMQSGIGPIILLNLAISLVPGLNISIGGHVGGLIGGAIAGYFMDEAQQRRLPVAATLVPCVVVGALAVAGAYLVT